MGTKRDKYLIEVGGVSYQFSGATWFYGDADVRSHTGVKLLTERTVGNKIQKGQDAKRKMIRLVATLQSSGILNVFNKPATRQYPFYCDPDKAEAALENLVGKAVDASLLPGDWEIMYVERKLEVSKR